MEGNASEVEPRAGWSRRQTVAAYAVAGAGYIILGGFFKEVFAWWTYGATAVRPTTAPTPRGSGRCTPGPPASNATGATSSRA